MEGRNGKRHARPGRQRRRAPTSLTVRQWLVKMIHAANVVSCLTRRDPPAEARMLIGQPPAEINNLPKAVCERLMRLAWKRVGPFRWLLLGVTFLALPMILVLDDSNPLGAYLPVSMALAPWLTIVMVLSILGTMLVFLFSRGPPSAAAGRRHPASRLPLLSLRFWRPQGALLSAVRHCSIHCGPRAYAAFLPPDQSGHGG